MLRNDQIQAALISYLKSRANILNALPDDNEIREDDWQGTVFSYPNVRVKLNSNSPIAGKDCKISIISVSILVFSEISNSLEADQIAGIINTEIHEKQFNHGGVAFALRTTNLIPAIKSDLHTWRSEVLMSGAASG